MTEEEFNVIKIGDYIMHNSKYMHGIPKTAFPLKICRIEKNKISSNRFDISREYCNAFDIIFVEKIIDDDIDKLLIKMGYILK